MRDGKEALIQKVEQYKPLIVCFNGKGDFTLLFCSCYDWFVCFLIIPRARPIYNHCLSCSSLNLKISFLVWVWVNELEVAHRLCQDRYMLIKPQKVNSDHMAAKPAQPAHASNTGIKFTKAKWASPAHKISTLPSAIPFNIVKWLQWA